MPQDSRPKRSKSELSRYLDTCLLTVDPIDWGAVVHAVRARLRQHGLPRADADDEAQELLVLAMATGSLSARTVDRAAWRARHRRAHAREIPFTDVADDYALEHTQYTRRGSVLLPMPRHAAPLQDRGQAEVDLRCGVHNSVRVLRQRTARRWADRAARWLRDPLARPRLSKSAVSRLRRVIRGVLNVIIGDDEGYRAQS